MLEGCLDKSSDSEPVSNTILTTLQQLQGCVGCPRITMFPPRQHADYMPGGEHRGWREPSRGGAREAWYLTVGNRHTRVCTCWLPRHIASFSLKICEDTKSVCRAVTRGRGLDFMQPVWVSYEVGHRQKWCLSHAETCCCSYTDASCCNQPP